jgi:hypothetical protein
VHHNNSCIYFLQDSSNQAYVVVEMASLRDSGMQSRVQRLFKRKGAHYSAVPNEDSSAQRDSDRQILDADEPKDVTPQQHEASTEQEPAAAGAEAAEVPATATLLGASGVASDSQQAMDASKPSKKQPKSLLSCLHFSKKEKQEKPTDGLPSAFNNRQSILKRLARSAKKSAPVTVVDRTPKPPKVCLQHHCACWATVDCLVFWPHGTVAAEATVSHALQCRGCTQRYKPDCCAFHCTVTTQTSMRAQDSLSCLVAAPKPALCCVLPCRSRPLRCTLLLGAPTPTSCWSSWQQALTWHAATRCAGFVVFGITL